MFNTDSHLWVVSTLKTQVKSALVLDDWYGIVLSVMTSKSFATPFFMDLAKQHVGSVDASVRRHLRMFPKDGHCGVVVGRFLQPSGVRWVCFQPNPTSRKLVPRHRPREWGGFTAWFAKTCSWWIRQRKSENFEQRGDANLKWLLFAVCWLLAQHFAREFCLVDLWSIREIYVV